MNQIVFIKDDNNKNKIKKKKFVFKVQFLFSIILFCVLVTVFLYFRYANQNNSNKSASNLSNSYQVYRLYANTNSESSNEAPTIIGNIDIPNINVSYPILSTLSEELLKISPCRFYGDISDNSNLCIAGHNFDNDTFFSKIRYLKNNDQITISDNNNTIYKFLVFDNYEVDSSNLSPIYETTAKYKKELTLVTCNNQNNKRIIIKARLAY